MGNEGYTPKGFSLASLSPKEIAERNFRTAQSEENLWKRRKQRACEAWKQAILDEAGSVDKCNCNICPECGKEKS